MSQGELKKLDIEYANAKKRKPEVVNDTNCLSVLINSNTGQCDITPKEMNFLEKLIDTDKDKNYRSVIFDLAVANKYHSKRSDLLEKRVDELEKRMNDIDIRQSKYEQKARKNNVDMAELKRGLKEMFGRRK